MATEALSAAGGFVAPTLPYHAAHEIERAFVRFEMLPTFRAVLGGITFEEPAVRWAREREIELRRSAQMWDWP